MDDGVTTNGAVAGVRFASPARGDSPGGVGGASPRDVAAGSHGMAPGQCCLCSCTSARTWYFVVGGSGVELSVVFRGKTTLKNKKTPLANSSSYATTVIDKKKEALFALQHIILRGEASRV